MTTQFRRLDILLIHHLRPSLAPQAAFPPSPAPAHLDRISLSYDPPILRLPLTEHLDIRNVSSVRDLEFEQRVRDLVSEVSVRSRREEREQTSQVE